MYYILTRIYIEYRIEYREVDIYIYIYVNKIYGRYIQYIIYIYIYNISMSVLCLSLRGFAANRQMGRCHVSGVKGSEGQGAVNCEVR